MRSMQTRSRVPKSPLAPISTRPREIPHPVHTDWSADVGAVRGCLYPVDQFGLGWG